MSSYQRFSILFRPVPLSSAYFCKVSKTFTVLVLSQPMVLCILKRISFCETCSQIKKKMKFRIVLRKSVTFIIALHWHSKLKYIFNNLHISGRTNFTSKHKILKISCKYTWAFALRVSCCRCHAEIHYCIRDVAIQ